MVGLLAKKQVDNRISAFHEDIASASYKKDRSY